MRPATSAVLAYVCGGDLALVESLEQSHLIQFHVTCFFFKFQNLHINGDPLY